MTLQEKAFMCDLIKKTYRRRMLVFTLFVVAIFMPIATGIFLKLAVASVLILGAASFIIFLVAFFYYQGNAYFLCSMPWKLKKMQVEALEAYSKGDFEDLICSAPLAEYFSI